MAENNVIHLMKECGETLGTRGLGERVRKQIIEMLRATSERLVLDFQGVRVMTQSFADEVFRKLRNEAQPEEVSRISIRNISEDVHAVLRYATSKPANGNAKNSSKAQPRLE